MPAPIIPRIFRGRLYYQTADVLFPTFTQAATAWSAAESHRLDIADELDQLIVERTAALADMRHAGADMERFRAACKVEAELALQIRQLRRAGGCHMSATLWDVFGENGDRHRQREIRVVSRGLPKRADARPPQLRGVSRAQWNRLYLVAIEMARMLKTKALLIAVQYAANDEAEFVVADALAVILQRFEQHIAQLDQRLLEAAS